MNEPFFSKKKKGGELINQLPRKTLLHGVSLVI
jgi:hypothetical protein